MSQHETVAAIAARHWASIKHGTLSQFVTDRVDALASRNLEQRQAAVTEYHGLVTQLVTDPDHNFSAESRRLLPQPKMSSHRKIEKYFGAMQVWETELITWAEREIFISTTFVWK